MKRFRKKHLTSESRCDRIAKPSGESAGPEQKAPEEIEKKISKKCLTNRDECARIANVPPRGVYLVN